MKYIVFILTFYGLCTKSTAQNAYWQQQVDYTINVSLNDREHVLDGFVKMQYTNHSPDTLKYIWFHLWPNAYKNDKTAFSEQMLENRDTKFYFASQEQRGYINQLDFRINDVHAEVEDDASDIDIVKVILPSPLLPGQSIFITTPFHVKLPYNFSRGGHIGQAYQLTQWYPKPAVYDSKGWHPMPYLNQGEFYSEFGNYEVSITIPDNYVVAATGILQNEKEKEWLKTRNSYQWKATRYRKKIKRGTYKTIRQDFPVSSTTTKTLQYKQDNVHDFAWFADKRLVVNYDTCALPSGKIIDVYAYYTPASQKIWKHSLSYLKSAVRFYAASVGEYPYSIISVTEGDKRSTGGMEYPTISIVSPGKSEATLEAIIAHETGHNWFYGILANNERDYPWMDEGMNSFYDSRYKPIYQWNAGNKRYFDRAAMQKLSAIAFESVAATGQDQPIGLSAPAFSALNYGLSAYYKTAEWMKLLESSLGKPLFDSVMQVYYATWKFRHPYPQDFKNIINAAGLKSTDSPFCFIAQQRKPSCPCKKKI